MRNNFLKFLVGSLFVALYAFNSPSCNDDIVSDVLKYTNQFRTSQGLQPLKFHEDLSKLAEAHSSDMASGKINFGHSGFRERSKKAQQLFSDYEGMGENVSFGSKSGKEAVEGWKNSPPHRENLAGDFRYIGIGIASSKNGDIYYTQLFVK